MAKIKFAMGLVWLLSLLTSIAPATASPDMVKWSRVNIPATGRAGNWVLAGGSDIQHLTMAIDGTLYAHANPSATGYTLFRSTDGGYSWSYTGEVTDNIVDLATAPDDASILYYATASSVYKSTDAASTFDPLPPNPGGAGSNNIQITSIDVARLGSHSIVAVGTRDTDDSQYGGVYILDEEQVLPNWTDTNIGSYDVYTVAFSPKFASDRQLVAVVTDENDTIVTTRIGDGEWGKIIGDAIIPATTIVTADIAFPDDCDTGTEDYALFMAIDTVNDSGDVYMISGAAAPHRSATTDLDIGSAYGLSNVDVTTLDIAGDTTTANLVAGTAGSTQVYFSTDGGTNWSRSAKEPTGESKTYVLMAPDFTGSSRAYAATSGAGSAFSLTQDGGGTWNQVGLIDTAIGIGNIIDLAVSPSYSRDDTLSMLTFDGEHSLWRSPSGGTRWERVFTSTLANADSFNLVELSPEYGNGSQVIFLAGTSNSNPAIWKSTDSGQSFRRRNAPFPIDVWTFVNDTTLFIGSYDGSKALVYHTTNDGWTYSTGAVAGSQSLKSIVLSPNYKQDKTILVGNTNGWVYWSSDNGTSFEPLPPDATSPPLSGEITVAFDPQFSSNKIVYAASNALATTESKERIYRFTISKSDSWESIRTVPEDSKLSQLVVSADGTLYAANLKADSGMERCLNPTYSLGPTFETVTRGLDDGTTLSRLWLCGNQLWSIDTSATRLMTFPDSLPLPVTLTSPPDAAPGVGTITSSNQIGNLSLDWETSEGATSYQWQLDYDTDFSTVPTGFEDETKASTARLPALEPATTYYWQVRAMEPVLSPWSTKWSFTTSFGSEAIALKFYSPEAGANSVPLKPIFQWSAIAGADSYELLVSSEVSFANPLIVKIGAYALPSTAWQCNISLDYDTTYYWKVRAINAGTQSAWSAVSAFTTNSAPAPELSPPLTESPPPNPLPPTPPPSQPPPGPPPPSPLPPAQQVIPNWEIYLIGALLLSIILLLIIMLVLVVATRRH